MRADILCCISLASSLSLPLLLNARSLLFCCIYLSQITLTLLRACKTIYLPSHPQPVTHEQCCCFSFVMLFGRAYLQQYVDSLVRCMRAGTLSYIYLSRTLCRKIPLSVPWPNTCRSLLLLRVCKVVHENIYVESTRPMHYATCKVEYWPIDRSN